MKFNSAFCSVAVLLLATLGSAAPQTKIFPQALSERTANYQIKVTLDDSTKTTHGELTLHWQNPSDDMIPDLRFHLYYNAFLNAKSTFIREMMGNAPWARDNGWGWIEVEEIQVRGVAHTDSMRFIAPDDGNVDDRTVLQVMLARPVQPRETVTIEMQFSARIPRNHRRTGWWGDDFFLMVHWFPKIGVYEAPGTRLVSADAPHGRWNCHQFHSGTEFYADFGVYDVEITLPEKYTVGTTGIIARETDNGNGTKTVVAHAEDVHEFAWVADSDVIDAADAWENIRTGQRVSIRLFLQPGHEIAREAYFNSAKFTLNYFDEWLGPYAYPYPVLTIVDPPPGSGAGGMEYPNLITGGTFYAVRKLTGGAVHDVELVTIHELGHQYWFGIVANNEFEEAFLDEGFTTYSENRIGLAMFGKKNSLANFAGLHVDMESFRRAGYALSDGKHDGTLAEFSYATQNGRNIAYNKWSLAMKTLENLLGRAKFDAIMREYFRRWKFKHPSRDDFIAVANERAGQDVSWFFEQVIYGDGVVDYGIAGISSVPVSRFERGFAEPDTTRQDSLSRQPADTAAGGARMDSMPAIESLQDTMKYYSKVTIRRIGEVKLPVEILVGFQDGEKLLEHWDGKARTHVLTYTRPARVEQVIIDPEFKIPLDVNYLNNSRVPPQRQVVRKYFWKWFFWMQSLLAFFSTIS